MHRRKISRGAIVVAAASALVAGVLAAAPGASAQQSRKVLANSAPKWLGHAAYHGKTSNKAGVNLRVYLAPQGGIDALKAAATAVSTPGSATYRQFINPAQYVARYAATNATVRNVESWLRSEGLRVTGVDASKRYISATGTVAAAQAAFGVSIHNYSHDGQSVQAPSGAASVPDSIAGSVLAVGGLDPTQTKVTTSHTIGPSAPPSQAFVNARPCSL